MGGNNLKRRVVFVLGVSKTFNMNQKRILSQGGGGETRWRISYRQMWRGAYTS